MEANRKKETKTEYPPEIDAGKTYSASYTFIDGANYYYMHVTMDNPGGFVIKAEHYLYGKKAHSYSKTFIYSTIPFGQYTKQRFNVAKIEQSWLQIFEAVIP